MQIRPEVLFIYFILMYLIKCLKFMCAIIANFFLAVYFVSHLNINYQTKQCLHSVYILQ